MNSILIARHRAMLKEDGQEAKASCIKGLVKKNSNAMETSAVKTRKIGTSMDWLRRSRGTYRFFLGLSQGFLALFPFSQSLDKDMSTPRSFIPFLLMISFGICSPTFHYSRPSIAADSFPWVIGPCLLFLLLSIALF